MCGFGARLRNVTTGLRCTTNSETTDEVSQTSTSAARSAGTSASASTKRAFGPGEPPIRIDERGIDLRMQRQQPVAIAARDLRRDLVEQRARRAQRLGERRRVQHDRAPIGGTQRRGRAVVGREQRIELRPAGLGDREMPVLARELPRTAASSPGLACSKDRTGRGCESARAPASACRR